MSNIKIFDSYILWNDVTSVLDMFLHILHEPLQDIPF